MSTTDTTTTTGLRLARFRTEQDARGNLPLGHGYSTEDSRTFFVDDDYDGYMSPGSGGTYTTVIVPTSDPRHFGMWEATGDHEGSHGWNVRKDALEYLDTPTETETERRPFQVGDRVVQSGPHYIHNGATDREYHESPRGIGSRAVVTSQQNGYGEGAAVSVSWDGGGRSVIATDSLTLESDYSPGEEPQGEPYVPQVGDLVEVVKTLVPYRQDRYGGMVGEVKRFDASDNSWYVEWNGGAIWATELRKVEGDEATLAAPAVRRAISAAVAEERARLTRTFEAWKEEATRVAHDYANNNSLCSEFDRCMADIGLRGRERTWNVAADLSFTVTAASEEEAVERARGIFLDLGYSLDAVSAELD